MRKLLCAAALTFIGSLLFSQELVIVVAPFEVRSGFSRSDADAIEHLFLLELKKTNSIKVLDQSDAMFREILNRMRFELSDWSNPKKVAEFGKALNANAVVLGRMMMLGDERIITARINTLDTEIQAANDMVVKNVSEVRGKLPNFTREIVNRLPVPNPFIGRWRSTVNSNGLTIICILYFNNDGSIDVEQYDTNRITQYLLGMSYTDDKKEGRGDGSYSLKRSGNDIIADITLTISGVSQEFIAITARASFKASNPNQFTASSMQCEYYVTGKSMRDYYKTFTKM